MDEGVIRILSVSPHSDMPVICVRRRLPFTCFKVCRLHRILICAATSTDLLLSGTIIFQIFMLVKDILFFGFFPKADIVYI